VLDSQGNVATLSSIQLEDELDNLGVAGYVQGEFEASERVTLSGGLQLVYEKKEIELDQFSSGAPLLLREADADEHWLEALPSAALSFRWSDEITAYAKAARGFKSGGFNDGAVSLDLDEDGGDLEKYDPETAWTFELGGRTSWLEQRLVLDATLYYTLVHDVQLVATGLDAFGSVTEHITNAGDAILQGAELTFLATPFNGILIDGGIALNDGRYLDLSGGLEPPFYPSFDSNFGVTLVLPMPGWLGGGHLSTRLDYHYQNETFFNAANTVSQDAYGVINTRVSWTNDDDLLSLAFFVRNLNDEEYLVNGIDFAMVGGPVVGQYGPPRLWGVEAVVSY
jgi:iron complex outermembrane receptor protein